MAPVYDLARSRYAPAAVAGCFAAALLVMAVMVASTSARIGGELRPAALPAESRTIVDGPVGPALPLQRAPAIDPSAPAPEGAAATAAPTAPVAPGAEPGPTSAGPQAPGPGTPPGTPVPPAPSTPLDSTVTSVVDGLTELIDALPVGAATGLLPLP